jgi:Arc/MetJ family transcription regulator
VVGDQPPGQIPHRIATVPGGSFDFATDATFRRSQCRGDDQGGGWHVPLGSRTTIRYHLIMSKTSVEVDPDIVGEAAEILGTTTLRATIDAALREVVHAKRRLELVAMLAEEGRFNFETDEVGWGGEE